MRFRLIEDHQGVWPVRVMCDALSVSPSGHYAWRSRPDSPRKIANRDLLADIRRVHAQHQERYGAPRRVQDQTETIRGAAGCGAWCAESSMISCPGARRA